MNKTVILNYLKKINKDDIINFGLSEGVNLSSSDTDTIYEYIKNKSNEIIENPINIINEIKNKLSKQVYDKIWELYLKYKPFLDKIK